MGQDLFANAATTTVSSGGTSAPSALTTESWTVASSTGFPAASNTATPATWFRVTDPALPSEVILVTNVSGTTWSVTRGYEGTTPVAHTGGFQVNQVVTAGYLNGIASGPVAGGVGEVQFSIKSADQSVTSSTTLTNDTHLTATISAPGTYTFQCFLVVGTGDSAADILVGFSFPTGTCHYGAAGAVSSGLTTGTTAATEYYAVYNKASASPNITYAVSSGQPLTLEITGVLIASATGTFRFMFAQGSSSGTATKVLSGSWMRVRREV